MSTLVFAISTLHLLVNAFLNLTLQDSGSCWLIKVCDFENLRSIYPAVSTPSHNMIVVNIEFVDRNLGQVSETMILIDPKDEWFLCRTHVTVCSRPYHILVAFGVGSHIASEFAQAVSDRPAICL